MPDHAAGLRYPAKHHRSMYDIMIGVLVVMMLIIKTILEAAAAVMNMCRACRYRGVVFCEWRYACERCVFVLVSSSV